MHLFYKSHFLKDLPSAWRYPFIFCLAWALPWCINCQTSYLGFMGGAGLTANVGLRVSLPAEFTVNRNIACQLELVYIQKGNVALTRKFSQERDYGLILTDYVSIPMLLKLKLDWKPIGIYALVGPEVAYGIKMYGHYAEGNNIYRDRLSFDGQGVRHIDAGLSVGIGLERIIRRDTKIFMDLRYYLGITDLDTAKDNDIFNEGQYLNLGVLFPL